jgi:uncharacterized membrane protein YkoI
MKRLLVCLALIFALAPSLAGAGNGNGNAGGNGGGNGNAYGHDNGNNGNGNPGGAGGGGGAGPDDGSLLSPGGMITLGTDQNQALDAFGSGALPLSDIADRAVARWGGRVIDAKLMKRGNALVYRLTVLSDAGVSRRVFYDARTGASLGEQ